MPQEEVEVQKDIPIDSENIFDEFTNSDDMKDEINRADKRTERDMYYYLKRIGTAFFSVNLLILITLIIGAIYIYIQEGEVKKEYSFLSPICGVFLGDNNISPNTCYGVSPIINEYNSLLSDRIAKQSSKIFPILGEIYSIENFNLSKKVSFLLEKNQARLKPSELLGEFDALKNTFSPTDKGEIACYDIVIFDDMLNISCDAFSSDWNTDIITLKNGSIETLPGGGTSISRASSFVYFLENYRDSPFSIIEKPKTFTSISVQSGPYTQKTTFSLNLRYSPKENLIF